MADVKELLERVRTIAVVGFSTDPDKTAHRIPRQLMDAGYHVIPVHRTAAEIAGLKAYRTLADIPEPVDLVDVFRPSPEAAEVTRQAIASGANGVWLQLGIASPQARMLAGEAGLDYVEDLCIGVEVRRYGITRRDR
ncbi:MAG: uncharacterized protein QOG64_490 [Acidimicrobiaceae bacterium]|nr:uncharacterized protein [Acidimicrobiaceae bacterium]